MGKKIHSYFLLFYKLPQRNNHTYHSGDESSLSSFSLLSLLLLMPVVVPLSTLMNYKELYSGS